MYMLFLIQNKSDRMAARHHTSPERFDIDHKHVILGSVW